MPRSLSKKTAFPALLAIFCLLLISSCGDKGGGTEPPPTPVATSVSVSPTSMTLEALDATAQFSAQVRDQNGQPMSGVTVVWASGNPSVATVNSSGLGTAIAVGSTTVTATAGAASGSASLEVTQVVSSVTVNPQEDTLIAFGETAQLSATVSDSNGHLIQSAPVIWSSSDPGTVQVDETSGLITTVDPGTATVTATSGDVSGTALITVVAPPVTQVELSPKNATISLGELLQMSAVARSAEGHEIAGASFNWVSSSSSIATVDESGLVTGISAGTASISAEAGGVWGSSIVVVTAGGEQGIIIESVTPSPLIEGMPATIVGTGFSPSTSENQVTVGGLLAQITSGSATQLQIVVPIADCLPPRNTMLTVARPGAEGTAGVTVSPETLGDLQIGEGFLLQNPAGCLTLSEIPMGEEYLIGVLSASEVPSSLTPVSLRASEGISVALQPAEYSPAMEGVKLEAEQPLLVQPPKVTFQDLIELDRQGSAPRRDWGAEAELRARERELIQSMGGLDRVKELLQTTVQDLQRVPSPMPSAGDTLEMYHGAGCDSGSSVTAVVRYVGDGAIWMEDLANPGPAFTVSELQPLDEVLTSNVLRTLQDNFGDFRDIDGNDRVIVLITKEVNEEENLLGFAWSGDLFPLEYCANSNLAEIFYGIAPDPDGTIGAPRTKEEVLALYPSLIAHELTHVVQFTQRFYATAGSKSVWEMEGGATLAEKLVGHKVLGYSSRSDLGWAAINNGWDWYWNWVQDLANYYGWSPSGRVPGAPEQCTWTGKPEDGNSGPCFGGNRAIYGIPAWLLQYVLDRYGQSYPGGDAAAMRRMTQSEEVGFSTLEDVAGESIKFILTRFAFALYTDGLYTDNLASWDLFDIFSHVSEAGRLQPYRSYAQAPQLDVLVRGGSTAYLLWTPSGTVSSAALKLRSQAGTLLPDHMAYWIMRLK